MTIKMRNSVGELIRILGVIRDKYGEDIENIPITINLYGEREVPLQAICLDNSDECLGMELFFEANREDKTEYKQVVPFYTTGKNLFNKGMFDIDTTKGVD